jgi:glucose-1-phosphate cytidylyltransferase
MKAVILAGGFGTRISEESVTKPKPMIEIGSRPILWHIMKWYAKFGIRDFVICAGYKSEVIKRYFAEYYLNSADVIFELQSNSLEFLCHRAEDWRVTVAFTGLDTMTGGRLKRIQRYIGDECFCMTYGDGVSDVDLDKLIAFHRRQGTFATVTAVQPPGRFGAFTLGENEDKILHFREKPVGDGAWINGGFFVLEPQVFEYIKGDKTVWEQEPMAQLAYERQLSAYRHTGFWQNMDTLRDKMYLEQLWDSGRAPWRVAADWATPPVAAS